MGIFEKPHFTKRHIYESIAYKDIFHEINGLSSFPMIYRCILSSH